jgi:hypothetical protein
MRRNAYDPQAARVRLMLAVVGAILLVVGWLRWMRVEI